MKGREENEGLTLPPTTFTIWSTRYEPDSLQVSPILLQNLLCSVVCMPTERYTRWIFATDGKANTQLHYSKKIQDYFVGPQLLPYDRILDRGISIRGPFRSVGWLFNKNTSIKNDD